MTTHGTATPLQFTRSLIDEVIWWHAQYHEDPDTAPVSYDDVMGLSRLRRVVAVRFDCIRRVRAARPNLSLPQLGRIFRRDHTTIMNAIDRRYATRYRRQKERRLQLLKLAQDNAQPEVHAG